MLKSIIAIITAIAAVSCTSVKSERESQPVFPIGLTDSLRTVIDSADAEVGIALICGDSLLEIGPGRYPMMSTFKLHVGLAVLKCLADLGGSVDSIVPMTAAMQHPDTYSPLRELTGGRDVELTIDSLMTLSVGRSDNNAADRLIEIAGGPEAVDHHVATLGIDSCSITQTEDDMHAAIEKSYLNWSSPSALAQLMKMVYTSDRIPSADRSYMQGLLEGSTTGRDKIFAGLPEGTPFGHKSGLSDRLPDNRLMGSADVAMFVLPDGRRCYLAIMVKDSQMSDSETSAIFSKISKVIYGAF
ncbi:MAG: class A beta-lactamase-related serine hydrolase [Staphylococcus sp.]|nr:class A beta-lactamase-related serine hydrolase [Staphylococcus sp.]